MSTSEKHPSLNPEELANIYANPAYHEEQAEIARQEARIDEWFDGTAENAADMKLYLENRPTKDPELGAISPDGTPIHPDEYFNEQRDIAEETSKEVNEYERMSMPELARKLATAEFHGDKTSEMNISEVLLEKLSEEELKHASTNDEAHNQQRSDNIWNRVMGIKDKELARLKANEPGDTDPADNSGDDAVTQKLDAVNPDGSAVQRGRVRGLLGRVRRSRDTDTTSPEAAKPQDDGESYAEKQRKAEERVREFKGYKPVRYQRDKATGNIRLASEFTQEDAIIPLIKVDKPMIVLTKDGSEYYLPEGCRGQMVDTNRTIDDKKLTTVENIAGMSTEQLEAVKIIIGKELKIGDTELGEVERVEIAEGMTNIETKANELRDEADPFTRNERIIMGAITATRENTTTDSKDKDNGNKPIDPSSNQNIRGRMKDAWYSAGARVQRTLSGGEKVKDNKARRRAAAPIVGAEMVGSTMLIHEQGPRPEDREKELQAV